MHQDLGPEVQRVAAQEPSASEVPSRQHWERQDRRQWDQWMGPVSDQHLQEQADQTGRVPAS